MSRKRAAKAVFLEKYPKAILERRRPMVGPSYCLVRKRRDDWMPFAEGPSPSKAWADACIRAKLDRGGV